jgi:excisionase family DNA binding protein
MEHDDRLVTVEELAEYLAVPVRTLYAWRYRGDGPPALRVGRHLRYRWCDVQTWIQQRIDGGSPAFVSGSLRSVGRKA